MFLPRDAGAGLLPAFVMQGSEITAGGGGDNVKVTGATIDRTRAHSAVILLAATTDCALAQTLKTNLEIEESADGSSWAEVADADYPGGAGAYEAWSVDGDGTSQTVAKVVSVDLSPYKRYVRFNLTPDLSAGSTDTATLTAIAALGGLVNTDGL